MLVKLITGALIFVHAFGLGVSMFLALLLALNGYSERVANYAFIVFIIGATLVSVLCTAGGVFLAGLLERKEWKPFPNILLSFATCLAVALVLKVVVVMIALGVAEVVRNVH